MSSPPDDGLRAYLSGLSKEQLVDRLLAPGERDEVALTALRAEKAAASGDLDLAAFRKELTARMRISGFVDWRGAAGYAQRVHGLLDVLEALIAAGRTADVVVLAEHVMARLDTALGRIDDSNGHMGGVLDRVADIHLAACLAARPEPKRLAVRLVEFALKSDWEWFLDAPQRYADETSEEVRWTMRPTEPFRREHDELLSHIEHIGQAGREVSRLDPEERKVLVGRILEFLRGTLLPHARAEEEVLYPEWAKLVGFADAAVPMVHDHEAIVARVERLEEADVGDIDTLQELLYGLSALISVHFRKEEDVQLPAFDAAPPEIAEAVLGRMEALSGHQHEHAH